MKKHPIIAARIGIQIALGAAIWFALTAFHAPLLWVIALGLGSAIIAGKAFCRWACPLGLLMELIFSRGGDGSRQSQYLYYKAGCPIAWAGGLLNRLSIFRIRLKDDACIACGKCDSACYITDFKEGASIFKEGALRPQDSYTCSRCLKCVSACPTGSLGFGIGGTKKKG